MLACYPADKHLAGIRRGFTLMQPASFVGACAETFTFFPCDVFRGIVIGKRSFLSCGRIPLYFNYTIFHVSLQCRLIDGVSFFWYLS